MAIAATLSLGFLPQEINPFYTLHNPIYFPILFAVVFISSLAPDFDEPNSYLSSKFPWIVISALLSMITTHRGVTHRFLAVFVYMGILTAILQFTGYIKDLWVLIPIGGLAYFTHLVGDGMTIGGLRRFWYPFSTKSTWFIPKPLRIYTGSFPEMIFLFLIMGLILAEVYFLFLFNKDFISSLLQNNILLPITK